jgi:hypothetical protein
LSIGGSSICQISTLPAPVPNLALDCQRLLVIFDGTAIRPPDGIEVLELLYRLESTIGVDALGALNLPTEVTL